MDEARTVLAEWAGLEPLTREPLQMASVPLPPCAVDEVHARLFAEHRIEAPVWEWNGVPLLRVSIQGYSAPGDLEALVEALPLVL